MDALRAPVRALRAAGAEILVLTNAAGSLRPEVGPGRLMAITDHINLTGINVLIGPNDDAIGPRVSRRWATPMTRSCCPSCATVARELEVELAEGVYLAVSGPSFETAAEIRAFARLGADAVGMSTVHETTVARHCGLRVARRVGDHQPGRGHVRRAAQPRADAARRRAGRRRPRPPAAGLPGADREASDADL